MPSDRITRRDLDETSARLRTDIEALLRKTEDHVLTALFGFVNSASARMDTIEQEAARLAKRVRELERKVSTLEKRRVSKA
jgi:predicted  nucleic acid-binding Zn-ribbon protein